MDSRRRGNDGKKIFDFFQKTPKVPQNPAVTLPRCAANRVSKAKKFLKFFRQNPKVLQNAAVTGLDVVKKSRFAALFFDLKG
ncbi:hypothetical protein [Duganella sp. P38]|uniref:hypothetical protein n=1 Tax=Duganella sp. P38 TaxID=3423949 RepID=UPI003D79C8E3